MRARLRDRVRSSTVTARSGSPHRRCAGAVHLAMVGNWVSTCMTLSRPALSWSVLSITARQSSYAAAASVQRVQAGEESA